MSFHFRAVLTFWRTQLTFKVVVLELSLNEPPFRSSLLFISPLPSGVQGQQYGLSFLSKPLTARQGFSAPPSPLQGPGSLSASELSSCLFVLVGSY